MLNKLEQFIVELLQGNLFYEGAAVPVVSEFNPDPRRPVITLDLGAGPTTERVHREITDKEQVYYYRKATININLWCDEVTQRQEISNNLINLFYKQQADNYIFCTNYKNGNCQTLQRECPASSTIKEKCPDPLNNNYENLATKFNIIHGCVDIKPPYFLTDTADHPPIYRAVFTAEAEYIDIYDAGGTPTENYNFNITID